MITFFNETVAMPAIERREITHWITDVAATYNRRIGEIGYLFCDDAKILEVNKKYLQHDYYTDIITFDYSNDKRISGDIFISVETVASNAERFSTPPQEELQRIIIHGILHLCGINDKSPQEEAHMRECENKALQLLNLPK